jgi:hypothetical protein
VEVKLQSLKSRGKITVRNQSEGNNTIASKSISKSSPEVSSKSSFFGKTQKYVSYSFFKALPTFA